MKISRMACLLIIVCANAYSASAQTPVAIVEDVEGQVAGLEMMDYLVAGRIFRLRPDETIVIDYLNSCVRERIQGGTVKIGMKQSEVESGAIERETVDCDAGKMMTTSGQDLATRDTSFAKAGRPRRACRKLRALPILSSPSTA